MTFFFFQAEDGIRDIGVTGVQTCALPIAARRPLRVDDLDAEPPQHANDAHADLGVYHVNVARHEKGYPHRSTTFPSYPITEGQYSNRSAKRVRPHLREAWTRC